MQCSSPMPMMNIKDFLGTSLNLGAGTLFSTAIALLSALAALLSLYPAFLIITRKIAVVTKQYRPSRYANGQFPPSFPAPILPLKNKITNAPQLLATL